MATADFITLFEGCEDSAKNWRKVGPNDFVVKGGEILTTGSGDFAVLYYSATKFSDFLLSLEFRLSDPLRDNSGVFVRFRNPELPPPADIVARDEFSNLSRNPAWIAAYSGFEVQIDEQARGSKQRKEPDGLDMNRTGAIYKIPTGEKGQQRLQEFDRAPPLHAGQWNHFEIEVTGQTYAVRLNGRQTTKFVNRDPKRGLPATLDSDSGYIGLQSYRDSRVGFRNVRIRPL